MYLADKFLDKRLAPAPNSNLRPLYYQWMFYASSLERHLQRFKMLKSSPGLDQELERRRNESERELLISARVISDRLKDGPYLLGDLFSAADITMFHWLWELKNKHSLLEDFPEVTVYLDALEARPARQRAVTLKP